MASAEREAVHVVVVSATGGVGKSSLAAGMVGTVPDGPDLGTRTYTTELTLPSLAQDRVFEVTVTDVETQKYADLAKLTGEGSLGVYDAVVFVAGTHDPDSYNGLKDKAGGMATARAKELRAARKHVKALAAAGTPDLVLARRLRPVVQRSLPVVYVFGNSWVGAGPANDVSHAPVVSPDEGASFAAGIDAYYLQGSAASKEDAGRVMEQVLRGVWRGIGDFDPNDAPSVGNLIPGPESDPRLAALVNDPRINMYPERNMNAPPPSERQKSGSGCSIS